MLTIILGIPKDIFIEEKIMKSKVLAVFALAPIFLIANEGETKLTAGGLGKISLEATSTIVRLGVELENADSESLEMALSSSLSDLIASIKKEGITKVDTTNYQIIPEYANANNNDKRTIKGFRGIGEVTFKALRGDAARIISKAMKSGSNRLNGVEFKASDEALAKGRTQAIQMAAQQALENAKSALSALGLSLKEIKTVDVIVNPPFPRPLRNELVSFAAKSNQLELEGSEEIEAQVNLSLVFTETIPQD